MTFTFISPLELTACRHAIAGVQDARVRTLLLGQLDAVAGVKRSADRSCGYYVDFLMPRASTRLPDGEALNKTPPLAYATHPDVKGGVFFILYVRDGLLSFMEIASTDDAWPSDESLFKFEEAS